MSGGGKIGNKNAFKGKTRTSEQIKEYGRVYMRNRRALLKGDIKQAQQFVGRPRKIKIKGDIFDVAAKLAKALKSFVGNTGVCPALVAWHEYWEND